MNWPTNLPDSEIKFLANSIVISPGRASNSVLEKVGGLGARQMWTVKEQGHLDHKLWAVRVQPLPPSTVIKAADEPPLIVLAHRKALKPTDASKINNWTPVPPDKQINFETVVGERIQLKVGPEAAREDDYDNPWGMTRNMNFNGNGRRRGGGFDIEDDGYAPRNQGQAQGNGYQKPPPYRGGNQNRGRGGGGGGNSGGGGDRGPSGGGGGGSHRNPPYPQRGGGRGGGNRDVSGGRGGGGQGAGGGGRNRGGRGGYKSLDDVGTNSPRYGGQGTGGYQNYTPNYDDGPTGTNSDYDRAFPPMGGAGAGRGNDSGGLPYGH